MQEVKNPAEVPRVVLSARRHCIVKSVSSFGSHPFKPVFQTGLWTIPLLVAVNLNTFAAAMGCDRERTAGWNA